MENPIKRSVVVSDPGACIQITRVELTTEATQALTISNEAAERFRMRSPWLAEYHRRHRLGIWRHRMRLRIGRLLRHLLTLAVSTSRQ